VSCPEWALCSDRIQDPSFRFASIVTSVRDIPGVVLFKIVDNSLCHILHYPSRMSSKKKDINHHNKLMNSSTITVKLTRKMRILSGNLKIPCPPNYRSDGRVNKVSFCRISSSAM
jgi:hypothetical protein